MNTLRVGDNPGLQTGPNIIMRVLIRGKQDGPS